MQWNDTGRIPGYSQVRHPTQDWDTITHVVYLKGDKLECRKILRDPIKKWISK